MVYELLSSSIIKRGQLKSNIRDIDIYKYDTYQIIYLDFELR